MDTPHGVVTLTSDDDVDQLLRRAVRRIDALGLEVFAAIDHSGDAAEAHFTVPESKLLIFGGPQCGTRLIPERPHLALDLPLKLLLWERGDGEVFVSYNAPSYLALRYGLTDADAHALRLVETMAEAIRSNA